MYILNIIMLQSRYTLSDALDKSQKKKTRCIISILHNISYFSS